MADLSPESLARISKVRNNELSMEALTDDELDGLLAGHGASPSAQAEPEAKAENSTEDGGDGKTANADTAENTKPKRSKKEIADEANTYRQRWDALQYKLKNNPEYARQFIKEHGLEQYVESTTSPTFDKNDLYKSSNLDLLMSKVERLEAEENKRAAEELARTAKEATLEEVEDFLASHPELAPKQGSLRKLNAKAERLYQFAGGDTSKLSDPEFLKKAEAEGFEIVSDSNFAKIGEIHSIRAQNPGLTLQDAYSVWQARHPEATQTRTASAPAQVASDRATAIVGTNANGGGGSTATLTLGQRIEAFHKKWGNRMSSLPPAAEAEWTQIETELGGG